MITIFHGDNIVASREALFQETQAYKKKGVTDVIQVPGKKLALVELQQMTSHLQMFGSNRLIVIEKFFKRPKSKEKDEIIKYLNEISESDIFVYEDVLLTATDLKKLPQAQVKQFKLTKYMYSFFEAIAPGNTQKSLLLWIKTIENDPPELVFFLLVKHIRNLLSIKDDPRSLSMPSWQSQKLVAQAQKFSLGQLLSLHQSLMEIDYNVKSGQSRLSLNDLMTKTLSTI